MVRKLSALCKKHNLSITFKNNNDGSLSVISTSPVYRDVQNISAIDTLNIDGNTLLDYVLDEIDSVFSGL